MSQIVNEALLTGAFNSIKAVFNATVQSANAQIMDISRFADTMTGTGKSVVLNSFGDMPAMRRWIGPRVIRNLTGKTYTVTNVRWEDTVGVDVIDLNTDQLGLIRPQIARMARESVIFKSRRFAVALEANALCADGQNLIDTDHPLDNGSTWSNKGTSALSFTALDAALVVGASVKDSNGDPAGINYNVLMVPTALRSLAFKLCNSVNLPGSAENDVNPLKGLEVVVNPFLTDTNNWYLFDTNCPVKPFVYTEAAGSALSAPVENRLKEFDTGQIEYGLDGWAEVSPYFPYGIYGAIV